VFNDLLAHRIGLQNLQYNVCQQCQRETFKAQIPIIIDIWSPGEALEKAESEQLHEQMGSLQSECRRP
jgi:hypothetical protein